ncbi:alpha/beta hydrolase [Micromonospora sp. NPDC005367]|uniref:alpha/beta fold hydrolase n=1 Tax=Micromonospora sp. NPDC005367 TaxID=3155590 RepID=UPI0033B627B2
MPERRFVATNGIDLMITEEGEGPLVLLLHGFPEAAHSWRHQFRPLVEAGYRVVAPEQRGYGRSSHPTAVSAYSMMHLVADITGLIRELEADDAVVIGHDWGAFVAWNLALMRPDLVRGVVGLSVPPYPRGKAGPLTTMRAVHDGQFYINYIEQPGVADEEYGRDPMTSLRRTFYGVSGDNPANRAPRDMLVPRNGGLLEAVDPERSTATPEWLTEQDLEIFTAQFADGFTGAFNWYRNLDRNWELTAAFDGVRLPMPAKFITGDLDPVLAFHGLRDHVKALPRQHDQFAEPIFLPGCGHWIQQERPQEVNRLLLQFLASLT